MSLCLESNIVYSFQIVKDPEDSEKSEPCSDEHNLDYDDCVYDKNHIRLASQLNCSFSFLIGNSTPKALTSSNECKLLQISKSDVVYFTETITGKYTSNMFYAVYLRILIWPQTFRRVTLHYIPYIYRGIF